MNGIDIEKDRSNNKIKSEVSEIQSKLFETQFEEEFINKINVTKHSFMNITDDMLVLFKSELDKIIEKNKIVKREIDSSNQKYHKIKAKIKDEYESYDSLNTTHNKLLSVNKEYKEVLRELDENINYIKSRKHVLQDNIDTKIKQRKVTKNTIKEVLNNLDDKIFKNNPTITSINEYKNDISQINDRLIKLIKRENSIFK